MYIVSDMENIICRTPAILTTLSNSCDFSSDLDVSLVRDRDAKAKYVPKLASLQATSEKPDDRIFHSDLPDKVGDLYGLKKGEFFICSLDDGGNCQSARCRHKS